MQHIKTEYNGSEKVNEGEIDWMNNSMMQHVKDTFEGMRIDSVWFPEGGGFIVKKVEDKKVSLVRCVNYSTPMKNVTGLKLLLFDLGYSFTDEDAQWDDVPLSEEDMDKMNEDYNNTIVASWRTSSGFPLSEIDGLKYFPKIVHTQEVLSEDGDITELYHWAVPLRCPETDEEVIVNPQDYSLLYGAEALHRVLHEGVIYQAHTRGKMAELIELGEYDASNYKTLGFTLDGEKIPEWMIGQHCEMIVIDRGEEE